VVVVPTKVLKASWEASLNASWAARQAALNIPLDPNSASWDIPKVFTQHSALLAAPLTYRYVVVDEVWQLSAVHVAALGTLGQLTIHLGDPTQIPAIFAQAANQIPYDFVHFTPQLTICVPCTFLPADSLNLLLHNGLSILPYQGGVWCLNTVVDNISVTTALPIDTSYQYLSGTKDSKGKFAWAGIQTNQIATAHEAQGTRSSTTVIMWDQQEIAFFAQHEAHLRVVISRAERVIFYNPLAPHVNLPGINAVNGHRLLTDDNFEDFLNHPLEYSGVSPTFFSGDEIDDLLPIPPFNLFRLLRPLSRPARQRLWAVLSPLIFPVPLKIRRSLVRALLLYPLDSPSSTSSPGTPSTTTHDTSTQPELPPPPLPSGPDNPMAPLASHTATPSLSLEPPSLSRDLSPHPLDQVSLGGRNNCYLRITAAADEEEYQELAFLPSKAMPISLVRQEAWEAILNALDAPPGPFVPSYLREYHSHNPIYTITYDAPYLHVDYGDRISLYDFIHGKFTVDMPTIPDTLPLPPPILPNILTPTLAPVPAARLPPQLPLGAHLPQAAGLDILPQDRVAYETYDILRQPAPIELSTLPMGPIAVYNPPNSPLHLPVYSSLQRKPFYFVQPQLAPPGTPFLIIDSPTTSVTKYTHLDGIHVTAATFWDVLRTFAPPDLAPHFSPQAALDFLERENSIFSHIELGPTVCKASLIDLNALNLDGSPSNRAGPNGLLQIIARHVLAPVPSTLTPAHLQTIERKLLRPKLQRTHVTAARSDKSSSQVSSIFAALDAPRAKDMYSTAFPKNDPPKKTAASGASTKTQGVTAYPPYIQALFSSFVEGLTQWLMINLRPGLWVDVGYTEEELSAIFSSIVRPYAQEYDLASQDSTHTVAHADIFLHLAKLAGLDGPLTSLFKQLRSHDAVQTLDHAIVSTNAWALGSGAPWTLLANCIMMLSSLALDTDFETFMLAMQKGDDFYCSHPVTPVPMAFRVFKGVQYTPRVDVIGSFCSRVYAHVIVRKLSRPLARLQELSTQPLVRFAQISAASKVVDDVFFMGTSYYARIMSMAFDMDIFDSHILLSAYLGAYHRALTNLYLPSNLSVPPLIFAIPPGSGKTTLSRKHGFTDIDDWFTPDIRAARDRSDWHYVNQQLTARYNLEQPAVLLLHHPALVSTRNAIIIATPYLGPPDRIRQEAHDGLSASLTPTYTATTHAGVESLVLRRIKSHTIRSLKNALTPPPPTITTVNPSSYCFFNTLHALTNTDTASDYWAMRVHDVPRPAALRTFALLNIPFIDIRTPYSPDLLSRTINRNPGFVGAIVFLDHVAGRAIKTPPLTPHSYLDPSHTH
jgi:hypothetical protein